jgi:hypothetical protein
VYQYERLHPAPQKPVKPVAAQAPVAVPDKNEIFEKLGLSEDQKLKLAALESQTTDPREIHRSAMKVLTEEQKAHLKNLRAEADAKREEQKAQREAKMAKMFPGNQRQVAENLNKQLRERQQQRRAAAQAAAGKPATANQ